MSHHTSAKAVCTTLESNERVIVTEWRFPPGAETGWHKHERDYVVVYRTEGDHLVHTPAGQAEVLVEAGSVYYRKRGIEHNVVNRGRREIVLIETELL